MEIEIVEIKGNLYDNVWSIQKGIEKLEVKELNIFKNNVVIDIDVEFYNSIYPFSYVHPTAFDAKYKINFNAF